MTRLTWTIDSRGTASAQVGVLWLSAGKSEDGSCWWLLAPGNRRSYGAEGRADSLADAQAAAEEAALSLLVEGVAAFAPASGSDGYAADEFASAAGADRCMGRGIALLCAALRARKETDR